MCAFHQVAYDARPGIAEPLFPEWLERRVRKGFWSDPQNHKRYLRWLGNRLGFAKWEDWYRLTLLDFQRNRGGSLVHNYYGASPVLAVTTNFPEYEWKEWLFVAAPDRFWDDPRNRRRYMRWLGEQLGFSTTEDWYKVTHADIRANQGSGLMSRFRGSRVALLQDCFPRHEWKEWLFDQTSRDFWRSRENRRKYMEWLGVQLGFQSPDDWYRVTLGDIRSHNGSGLDSLYGHSPAAMVMGCLPGHDWKEWLFGWAPVGFWKRKSNRLRYLRWLEGEMGIAGPEDWYRVTQGDFVRESGSALIRDYYGGSVVAAAKELYPDYDWQEWMFAGLPRHFWKKRSNRKRYLKWLAGRMGIRRASDWLAIRWRDLQPYGGLHLLRTYYHGSVRDALKDLVFEC
jgi:hypothetical protein